VGGQDASVDSGPFPAAGGGVFWVSLLAGSSSDVSLIPFLNSVTLFPIDLIVAGRRLAPKNRIMRATTISIWTGPGNIGACLRRVVWCWESVLRGGCGVVECSGAVSGILLLARLLVCEADGSAKSGTPPSDSERGGRARSVPGRMLSGCPLVGPAAFGQVSWSGIKVIVARAWGVSTVVVSSVVSSVL